MDAAGNVIKSYGYRPNSTWTTDPLFMKVGPSYYFFQNDHLGTPQKITAVNGAVVWSAKYSSFGQTEVNTSSIIINNLRFPGQYYDNETGLHYNWNRFYDSEIGRYQRTDPIGLEGGVNLFAYVFNNPVNWVDPNGKECTCDSSPWDTYPNCESENLTDRGFEYKSEDEAFRQVQKEMNTKNLTKHGKRKKSIKTGGRHINIRYNGEQVASLLSIKCCDDSSGHPEIIELWAIVNRRY